MPEDHCGLDVLVTPKFLDASNVLQWLANNTGNRGWPTKISQWRTTIPVELLMTPGPKTLAPAKKGITLTSQGLRP